MFPFDLRDQHADLAAPTCGFSRIRVGNGFLLVFFLFLIIDINPTTPLF